MDTPTEPRVAADAPPPEPRQRWRLTFARAAAADGETPAGRDYISAWEAALRQSGLPVAITEAGRIRFALGAPLPARTAGQAELADIWLTDRVAAWRVREALSAACQAGTSWWRSRMCGWAHRRWPVGSRPPTIASRSGATSPRDLYAACGRLMAAEHLIRERAKGGESESYDLRPLLMSIGLVGVVDAPDGGHLAVSIRTRIHPELGSGRPEEVLAALEDELGEALEPVATVRERLVLIDDIDR